MATRRAWRALSKWSKEKTMTSIRKLIRKASSQRGQGMAEYAMVLALVAVVAVAALTPLGTTIVATLNSVTAGL
jgi:Flp pilus assembly pilin Flp